MTKPGPEPMFEGVSPRDVARVMRDTVPQRRARYQRVMAEILRQTRDGADMRKAFRVTMSAWLQDDAEGAREFERDFLRHVLKSELDSILAAAGEGNIEQVRAGAERLRSILGRREHGEAERLAAKYGIDLGLMDAMLGIGCAPESKYVTREEAAAALGCNERTLDRAAEARRITMRHKPVIPRAEVQVLLQRQTNIAEEEQPAIRAAAKEK